MADSGSVRTQRYRLHRAGDHSLCLRCAVQRADESALSAVPVTDATAGLRLLAGQLTVAYAANTGNALLARELRMTLQALMSGKPDDDLAGLFAELGAS